MWRLSWFSKGGVGGLYVIGGGEIGVIAIVCGGENLSVGWWWV